MSIMFSSGTLGCMLAGTTLAGSAGSSLRNSGELFRTSERTAQNIQGSQKLRSNPEKNCSAAVARKASAAGFQTGTQCAGGSLAGRYGSNASPEEEFALIKEQLGSICSNSRPLPGLEVLLNNTLPGAVPESTPLLSAGTLLLLSQLLLQRQYESGSLAAAESTFIYDSLQQWNLYVETNVIPLWLLLYNQLTRLKESVLKKKSAKDSKQRKEREDGQSAEDGEADQEDAPLGSSRSLQQALEDMSFMWSTSTPAY